jgi:hypothetical protein
MMVLTTHTPDMAMAAEILPLFKQHERVADDSEDALCTQYIKAAVAAAENYLDRDVWPTIRGYSGSLLMSSGHGCGCSSHGHSVLPDPYRFEVRRGRATAITVTDAGNVAIPVDQYMLVAPSGPQAWGYSLVPRTDLAGVKVGHIGGFADMAELPPDLLQFILVTAGWMYEMREFGNYTSAVQMADDFPVYLLDSWAQLRYAV